MVDLKLGEMFVYLLLNFILLCLTQNVILSTLRKLTPLQETVAADL